MNDKLENIGGRKVAMSHSLRAMAKMNKSKSILVLDRSGSMADIINYESPEPERKIDALRKIVGNLRTEADFEQLVFDSQNEWTEQIGDPRGGTALAEALEEVTALRPTTRRVVLITDGWPDNRHSALAAAKSLPCPLDIFYVGPLTDTDAQNFLKQLAESAGGLYGSADLSKDAEQLENKVRLALKAGDPDEIKRGPIVL